MGVRGSLLRGYGGVTGPGLDLYCRALLLACRDALPNGGGGGRRRRSDGRHHLAGILIHDLARILIQLQMPAPVYTTNLPVVLDGDHIGVPERGARARAGGVLGGLVARSVGRVDAIAIGARRRRQRGPAVHVFATLPAAEDGAEAVFLLIFRRRIHDGDAREWTLMK